MLLPRPRLHLPPRLPLCKHLTHRTLWSASTASAPTLFAALRACLSNLHPAVLTSPDVCVVLATGAFPAEDIEALPMHVDLLLDRPKCTVGCVVDRVPTQKGQGSGHGISVLVGKFAGRERKVRGFVMEEEKGGRRWAKEKSVGRWGAVEDFGRVRGRAEGWEEFRSVSRAVNTFELPKGLAKSRDDGKKEKNPSLIFLASDKEPYQLLETLDHHSPNSFKLGLIASSTPFVTGRPYTLFFNSHVLSGGTVGFAITEEDDDDAGAWGAVKEEPAQSTNSGKVVSEMQVAHPGLEKLGGPIKITRSRGNIILDLDSHRATNLLLDLVQKTTATRSATDTIISKEREFYLAMAPLGAADLDGPGVTVARITSGDPAKGNMAVDTVRDLVAGQVVQFMHRIDGPPKVETTRETTPSPNTILLSLSVSDPNAMPKPAVDGEEPGAIGVFGGSSENGVIIGRGGDMGGEGWVCDVPWSRVEVGVRVE